MTDTHKENGSQNKAVGEKCQTNIVEFPLVIQMERILREINQNKQETKELLKMQKSISTTYMG